MRTLLWALAASVLNAGSPDPIQQGFDLLYNVKFAEAREAFSAVRPQGPLAEAGVAAAYLFEEFDHHGVLTTEFFLSDETLLNGIKGRPDTARMAAFHRSLERARATATAVIARDGESSDALFTLTLAAGMEANAATLIEKHPWEALKRIRESEALAARLLATDPSRADAYMAMGAASYIVGSLPPYKRAVLWFGGVHGDRHRGLNQLEIAARDGTYLKTYSKIFLALSLLREHQQPRAMALLDELIRDYPQSPAFRRERPKFQARAN